MTSADKVFKEMETESRRLQGAEEEEERARDLKGPECQLHSFLMRWLGSSEARSGGESIQYFT